MLLPFLLLQYPVGRLADKYLGEKELIIFALTLTSLTVAYLYFLDSRSVYVWAGVLFMTRVGISMLEVLRDSYFYKRIDGDDVAKIDLFRTSMAIAYIVFALISVVVLQFYPVKTVFLILFVALFTGLWPAWRLLDNKSEREMKKI
jgi:MFS family permease